MAYWGWSFVKEKTANFNLVTVKFNNATGLRKIQTTNYFDIMKIYMATLLIASSL
jgi:hypothetical protein